MSKYNPLGHFLARNRHNQVPMTFAEIEKLLGFPLPPKAQQMRAWWSNNPDNNVMTRVWLAAGFRTEQVDVSAQRLVFRRVRPTTVRTEGAGRAAPARKGVPPPARKPRRHPAFGLMKGLTRIAPGTDLTAPTGSDWGRSE